MRPHYSIVTPSNTEPITLDQATAHLRVDSADDLEYIAALIPVAREYVEDVTGQVMGRSTWLMTFESWGCASHAVYGRIPIFRSPLVSVESVKYYAPDATELSTLATTEYRAITTSKPGSIQIHGTFPSVDDRPDAIQVSFTAGDGCNSPATLTHAVKMLVTHLYENRMPVAFTSCQEIPYTLKTLIENNKLGGWS